MTLGIRIQRRNKRPLGIGDLVVFTSLPENYFHHTGKKLVDVDKLWVFDHNPYVLRDVSCDEIINLWTSKRHKGEISSLAHRHCIEILGADKYPILRHPRLYFSENQEIDRNLICVHMTGISDGHLPDHVIEQINSRYSRDYRLVQIGSKTDKNTTFEDSRGLDIWKTIKLISKCSIYIGVTSGPVILANCFPRVCKKVILTKYSNDTLDRDFRSCKAHKLGFDWIDHNWQLYNPSEYDRGVTMSYLKI